MPEQPTQFRIALHGYNREDVVAFIDRMSREHGEIVRRLEERNERLRAELAQTKEALAAAGENSETEKALADTQALAADLRARNTELEAKVRSLETALEEAGSRGDSEPEPIPMTVTQDLSEPIPPISEVLPVTVAPSKDYTELELAAYRRAELAERLARERSQDIYRQVQSVFDQAGKRLDTGRADLENLSRTLTADVNEMLNLLTNLNGAYRQAETSFAEIDARNNRLAEGQE